ncbi:MAG TPA: hypothetical protein VIL42_02155 [Sphingomicrobium sp.]
MPHLSLFAVAVAASLQAPVGHQQVGLGVEVSGFVPASCWTAPSATGSPAWRCNSLPRVDLRTTLSDQPDSAPDRLPRITVAPEI